MIFSRKKATHQGYYRAKDKPIPKVSSPNKPNPLCRLHSSSSPRNISSHNYQNLATLAPTSTIVAVTLAINLRLIIKDNAYKVKTRNKLTNYTTKLLKLSYPTFSRCRVSSMPLRSRARRSSNSHPLKFY